MRVVGGTWRGRMLKAPEGRGARPTTDRMRESIASMVLSEQGLNLADERVLDAFAGSGAMGIELLSRGAASCTFCEQNRHAASVIRANCEELMGRSDRWHVLVGDVTRIASGTTLVGGPFSIVFLDPPYAMPAAAVADVVQSLVSYGHLTNDCLVVYERAANSEAMVLARARLIRTKKHGGTCVDTLRMEDA